MCSGVAASGLWSTSSVMEGYGFSCSEARGILRDQGLNLCLLNWQADSLSLSHLGSPNISTHVHIPDDFFLKIIKKNQFILFLAVLGLIALCGVSLVVTSRGYSFLW